MLTEEQLEFYYREGYIMVPGLVPQEEVEAVLAAVPPEIATGDRWRPVTFEHADPMKAAALHRLLVEPHVTAAVADIFSQPPRVYYGMLAVVPAHGGHGLPWHQDNQYEQVIGGALNVFVALCDITPDKAILWVAPRSHLMGLQPWRDSDLYGGAHREAAAEPENGIPLPAMKAGDVGIFDRSTYHRSLSNLTDEHRYAYAAQYQAENARQASTGKKDPSRMLASELRQLWREQNVIK
jgi:ectoine hydroxylase-related dioxygenase (phytanoyl-CoA dioxygenase family)